MYKLNFLGKKPDSFWPQKGEITFDKAVLAYSKDDPPVLKSVKFIIRPREKVSSIKKHPVNYRNI